MFTLRSFAVAGIPVAALLVLAACGPEPTAQYDADFRLADGDTTLSNHLRAASCKGVARSTKKSIAVTTGPGTGAQFFECTRLVQGEVTRALNGWTA